MVASRHQLYTLQLTILSSHSYLTFPGLYFYISLASAHKDKDTEQNTLHPYLKRVIEESFHLKSAIAQQQVTAVSHF